MHAPPTESCVNKGHYTFVVAPGHRGFIHDMTTGALHADTCHILVPADSRVISMRVHRQALHHPVVLTPNVESGELTTVQSDWREGLRDLEQSRISNLKEALDEVRNFLQRDDGLGARERMARKPVLRSACSASSVTAENRWESCRTTSGRSREY